MKTRPSVQPLLALLFTILNSLHSTQSASTYTIQATKLHLTPTNPMAIPAQIVVHYSLQSPKKSQTYLFLTQSYLSLCLQHKLLLHFVFMNVPPSRTHPLFHA